MILVFLLILSASAYNCGDSDSSSSYETGDRVPVCVIVTNGETTKIITFKPRLDEYSAVEVKGIYVDLQGTGSYSLAVQAETSNHTDFLEYLEAGSDNTTDEFVVPVYSVVIEMEDGKVKEVVWDNGCDLCSDDCKTENEDVCTMDLCTLQTNTTGTTIGSDCDPKIYVSWIGKDSAGNYLMSAGYRISQFRKYSLYDSYRSAKKNF